MRRAVGLATVVAVSGSAPRGPGASSGVDAAGTACGFLFGGCAESAVHELCLDAIASGTGGGHRFGHSAGDAFAVGLTCGGGLDVLITPDRRQDLVRCDLPCTRCSTPTPAGRGPRPARVGELAGRPAGRVGRQ
ncbi:XdhC family protein [Streptomyces sp. NPDC051577]|uniref:XdhC family protein n=1 Tax=Streptomyces sp. NPDC051577 TaxID=3155166 RepID=UPI003438DEA5